MADSRRLPRIRVLIIVVVHASLLLSYCIGGPLLMLKVRLLTHQQYLVVSLPQVLLLHVQVVSIVILRLDID